jgi:hypothetical protein
VFLETRAVRRRQIAKQAEERRSEQKQRLAESCALFRLPIEVQMIIYVYAMSGNGGVIYVDWHRGPSLKYYSETFYECSKLWQQRSDGNSDPAVQVACDAIDKAIDEGTLYCLESRMSTFRQCDLCVPSHVTHGVICFSQPTNGSFIGPMRSRCS